MIKFKGIKHNNFLGIKKSFKLPLGQPSDIPQVKRAQA